MERIKPSTADRIQAVLSETGMGVYNVREPLPVSGSESKDGVRWEPGVGAFH